ncbi:MAG: hypothetical protein IGS23_02430 [Rivularia sp. T60_A2020_040]|nr:hypothetical protein [Rivularia sp. T60_A2020_040]
MLWFPLSREAKVEGVNVLHITMSANWTQEQILALAPDASSAQNGKALATYSKWSSLGRVYLLIKAFNNLENLSNPVQVDIRQASTSPKLEIVALGGDDLFDGW